MGVVVISLGAPETVAQPMRESQTNSERCLGSYGYSFERLQALSEILLLYPEQYEYPPRMMHGLLFIINF